MRKNVGTFDPGKTRNTLQFTQTESRVISSYYIEMKSSVLAYKSAKENAISARQIDLSAFAHAERSDRRKLSLSCSQTEVVAINSNARRARFKL